MQTTHLSSNRHVIIPKSIYEAYQIKIGQEIEIELTAEGILLKTKKNHPKTNIDDVAGCLAYQGNAKTIEDMDSSLQPSY